LVDCALKSSSMVSGHQIFSISLILTYLVGAEIAYFALWEGKISAG